jgi:hypothetical protein
MIRLDFPGYSGGTSLDEISWDEWFKAFDENNLALVYQNETAKGEKSNFNKLVGRETARARGQGDSGPSVILSGPEAPGGRALPRRQARSAAPAAVPARVVPAGPAGARAPTGARGLARGYFSVYRYAAMSRACPSVTPKFGMAVPGSIDWGTEIHCIR